MTDPRRRSVLAALTALPLAGSTSASAQALGDRLAGIAALPRRAALAALPAEAGAVALLAEPGRAGLFAWRDENLRAAVRSDPLQGLHIAPAADPGGGSGAWVRIVDGPLDVRWFGALADGKSDDGPAFNAALAMRRPVHAPAGVYRIATPIAAPPPLTETFTAGPSLSGDGMGLTILEGAFPDAPLIELNGHRAHFLRGTRLEGFTLRPHAAVAGSRGIDLLANYQIAIERLEIIHFQGDAIRFTSMIGDADGGDTTGHVRVAGCNIRANGGFGINTVLARDVIHVVLVDVAQSFIWYNAAGGIRTGGHFWNVDQCSIYGNRGQGGLAVIDSGGTAQMIAVRRTEFDNNEPQHILLERIHQFESEDCQFNFSDDGSGHGFRPVRLLDASPSGKPCANVRFVRPRYRSTPVDPELPTTLYRLGEGVSGFAVVDPFYQHFQGANAIDYAGLPEVQEERRGGGWQGVRRRIHSASGANHVPDLRDGSYHAVKLEGARRCSIGNPLNPADGAELVLEILNATEGEATVAFGADILQTGWSTPAYGWRRTGHFIYRAAMGKWLQIGLWSGELR